MSNPEKLARDLTAAPPATPSASGPRRAFVFGGGGVLGFAWMVGALTALQDDLGVDPHEAEVAVGTSAGSVVAALLGCAVPVDAIRRHHQGIPAPDDPQIGYDHENAGGGALPPRPGLRPAAPGLVLNALRRPGGSPLVALSGLLPAGRGSLSPLHRMVAAMSEQTGHLQQWPTRPAPWIVAVDYERGRRTVFRHGQPTRSRLIPRRERSGRWGSARRQRRFRPAPSLPYGARPAPVVSLADAVTASCSIPGWYPPVMINDRPYIDGGVASNASVDLLSGCGFDEVYVLAPMASVELDAPRSTAARLERMARRAVTRHILADITELERQGARVTMLCPGPEDLAVIGANLMNPARRTHVLETAVHTTRARLARIQARSAG